MCLPCSEGTLPVSVLPSGSQGPWRTLYAHALHTPALGWHHPETWGLPLPCPLGCAGGLPCQPHQVLLIFTQPKPAARLHIPGLARLPFVCLPGIPPSPTQWGRTWSSWGPLELCRSHLPTSALTPCPARALLFPSLPPTSCPRRPHRERLCESSCALPLAAAGWLQPHHRRFGQQWDSVSSG